MAKKNYRTVQGKIKETEMLSKDQRIERNQKVDVKQMKYNTDLLAD